MRGWSGTRAPAVNPGVFLGVMAVTGVAAGIVVAIAGQIISQYGPSGDSPHPWSYRGNGALVVLGLALVWLGAGCAAVILHARRHPRWRMVSAVLAIIATALFAADPLSAALLGWNPFVAADGLVFPLAALALPALALVLPPRRSEARPTSAWLLTHAAAAFVFAVALGAGITFIGF